MMTGIKLCGISRLQDVPMLNECAPQYVGFVFAPRSRRFVEEATAMEIRTRLHRSIETVGVFVDQPIEQMAALANSGVIQAIQLHGHETEETIRRLREQTDARIIQAFSVRTEKDVAAANASSADLVLLDSGEGGTGCVFDWQLLAAVERAYILAGGLHAGNVASAIRRLHPYAVDVSSGIETDGQKDASKIRQFVSAVRDA